MKEVKSSNISHIGYEDGKLLVKFKSSPDKVYEYPGVTEAEHDALVNAKSIGSHYAAHIRGREFNKRDA